MAADENAKHADDEQNQSARRSAEARGGVAPHEGDPTSPAEAEARAATRIERMKKDGFGDDKGGRY